MLKVALAAAAAVSLAACVTTPETRAKELAYCEQMERQMGTEHVHDHAAAKGAGVNPMNVTHHRCQQMLEAG
jgi:hypothetical protein